MEKILSKQISSVSSSATQGPPQRPRGLSNDPGNAGTAVDFAKLVKSESEARSSMEFYRKGTTIILCCVYIRRGYAQFLWCLFTYSYMKYSFSIFSTRGTNRTFKT